MRDRRPALGCAAVQLRSTRSSGGTRADSCPFATNISISDRLGVIYGE